MNRLPTLQLLREERGFTLIELLVVVLIIGILAAIAIPAFLGQRQKSHNSAAKSAATVAAMAAETYATDHEGRYAAGSTPMTIVDLQGIEPSLSDNGAVAAVAAMPVAATATQFTVTVKSKSGSYYSLTRSTATGVTFRCTSASAPSGACTTSNW